MRAHAMAKWLVRAGWEVTVITPRASVWRTTEAAGEIDESLIREGIRCLRTAHAWRSLTPRRTVPPFEEAGWLRQRTGARLAASGRRVARSLGLPKEIGWVRPAQRAAARLEPGSVDLVLATGSPFVSFEIARRLSRRLGCPFVLDYRDLWWGNPYAEPRSSPRDISRERRLLAQCAAAIAVSPGLAGVLDRRFGIGAKVHVLTNGFDAEELSLVPAHDFGHFAVVYTGRFYPPGRVATPLCAALSRLARDPRVAGRRWAFHYYGRHPQHVREEARKAGMEDHLVLHGDVSRREALAAVRGAGMAAVISSTAREASPEEKGVLTGKVFEPIGMRRPIVAIAPPGSDLEAVLATAGLGRRFAGDEVEAISEYLAGAIAGRVLPPREPEVFDWARLAPRLDRILRSVLERPAAASLYQY